MRSGAQNTPNPTALESLNGTPVASIIGSRQSAKQLTGMKVLHGRPRRTQGRTLRVLVVDDNRDGADSFARLIKIWGHDVRPTSDGEEGLKAAIEYEPDCLFLDINMPRMDGYALATHLRQHQGMNQAKMVALTANFDSVRGMKAGFDYHFVKPADLAVIQGLLTMLDEVVKVAKKTEELARENVKLAGETKQLIKDVKEEVTEVKEEVKELKQELREIKEEKPHETA